MASFKKVRYIQFVDDLPKNPSGKILKRELREKYATLPLPPKISGRL
jgi:fatty-acyl-CoA synthase